LTTKRHFLNSSGQSLVEFAMILPLVIVLSLGVIEVGYALLDQHVVTKLTREGSNLISRDVTLEDATTALKSMTTRPVNFNNSSRMIFSVIRKVATAGSPNYDRVILYQRHAYGSFSAPSKLSTAGPASFGGAPNYVAPNSESNTNLRITNLPANLTVIRGSMLYITEVYTRHPLITPLDRFGITVPDTLYSIAYF
jgi:TadE-like protein